MSNNWDAFKDDVRAVLQRPSSRWASEPESPEPEPTPVPVPTPISPKRNLWLIGLLVLALSLGITILLSNSNTQLEKPEVGGISSPLVTNENIVTKDDANLQQQLVVLNNKVRLLGSISNNNWNSYNRRVPSNDLIFLEKDWKINQLPQNLQKTEADTQFFQEWTQEGR